MPGRETDDIDRKLREIFLEEWRVDGFGDQHVADAMRRAFEYGRISALVGDPAKVTKELAEFSEHMKHEDYDPMGGKTFIPTTF